jgi:hypothetical protein
VLPGTKVDVRLQGGADALVAFTAIDTRLLHVQNEPTQATVGDEDDNATNVNDWKWFVQPPTDTSSGSGSVQPVSSDLKTNAHAQPRIIGLVQVSPTLIVQNIHFNCVHVADVVWQNRTMCASINAAMSAVIALCRDAYLSECRALRQGDGCEFLNQTTIYFPKFPSR